MALPGPQYGDNPRITPETWLSLLGMMMGMTGGMNPRLPYGRTPTTPGGMRSVRTMPLKLGPLYKDRVTSSGGEVGYGATRPWGSDGIDMTDLLLTLLQGKN